MTTVNKPEEGGNVFAELLAAVPDGEKLKTCIQCGSCSATCQAAGKMPVTPRKQWRYIQLGMEPDTMDAQNFWQCTTCALCEERCPRGIPLSKLMTKLREYYTEHQGAHPVMSQLKDTLEKSRNITGDDPANRFLWMDNLGFDDKQKAALMKDRAEVIYFTGCVSSLFPQAYKIPQSLVSILLSAGVDFTVLGGEEWCCGYPLYGGGLGEKALEEYARYNMELFKSKGAKTVILSCPTCLYIFKNIYPKLIGADLGINVQHYSEYLIDMLKTDKFNFDTTETIVTYHDPCDLGRKSHITEEPRAILKNLPGVKFVEMRFNRDDSKCCGGGGNLEMLNPDLAGEIAQERVAEATETGAQYLLTTCQQCKRTLQGGARKSRSRMKVYDLLEFIAERIKPAGGEV